MDDPARIQADLVAWELLDEEGAAWSRRLRGAVMRAASRMAELERQGKKPQGGPLSNAVTEALAEWPLPPGAAAGPAHVRFLVAVELAALPEALWEKLGP